MKINVNNIVRVKLTERGKAVHRDDYNRLFAGWPNPPDYIPPKEDENGWSEWQLWSFMQAFGEHTNPGLDCCFETTIEIVTPNDKDQATAEGGSPGAQS